VEATVSYYSDDASLLPPNAPLATGKPAIRALWTTLLGPGVSLSWQPTKVEVARSGELAYVMGTYADTAKDAKGNTVSDHGKLIEIWKKQTDGQWKVVADIYNSDVPAPAAEAKK
jgi:ketosteroid isomerase-like protein